MSDDFDREAEKEKLRQQFEKEEEARRSTQHMSELLLKGATMTNVHCDECGDPIFRDGGREFCPTCQRVVGGDGAETADAESAEAAPGSGAEVPDRTADGTADPLDDGPDAASGTGADPGAEARADGRTAAESGTGGRSPTTASGTGGPTATAEAPRRVDVPASDLDEARAALARKLTTLARQAEATDDVGRARTLLAATREAAEALAAVDSIGR